MKNNPNQPDFFRLGAIDKSAPPAKLSGAVVAQTGAPPRSGPPKGIGAGANAAPLRPMSGAALAPIPLEGPVSASREDRISYYRAEIKSLTSERVNLTGDFDRHEASVRDAHARLGQSYKESPVFAASDVMAYRMRLYDQLLQAGIKWGKQARQYRHLSGVIKTLTGEIERLEGKAK